MHVFKIYDSEGVVTELRRRHGTEPRSAMLANRGVACQRMLPRLGSIAAALLLATALMAEIPEHLRYATLPRAGRLHVSSPGLWQVRDRNAR